MPTHTQVESVARATLARLTYAVARGQALLDDIAEWRATRPERVKFGIASDRSGWFADLTGFDPEPDLDGWGIRMGEVAHHFRSLLNTMLSRMAQAEGIPASRSLQYPVALTRRSWNQSERARVGRFPERLQRLFYASQPFVMTRAHKAVPEADVLAVLAWADNEQKHRLELSAITAPEILDFIARATYESVPGDEGAKRASPRYSVGPLETTPGWRITADVSPLRVQTVDEMRLSLLSQVAFLDSQGLRTEVGKLLWEFLQRTRSTVFETLTIWSDENFDVDRIGASVDFVSGASFGRAAVDAIHGAGRWEKDLFNSPRFGQLRASAAIEILAAMRDDIRLISSTEPLPPL